MFKVVLSYAYRQRWRALWISGFFPPFVLGFLKGQVVTFPILQCRHSSLHHLFIKPYCTRPQRLRCKAQIPINLVFGSCDDIRKSTSFPFLISKMSILSKVSGSSSTSLLDSTSRFPKYLHLTLVVISYILQELIIEVNPTGSSSPSTLVAASDGSTSIGIFKICQDGTCSGWFQSGNNDTSTKTTTLLLLTQLYFIVNSFILWMFVCILITTLLKQPASSTSTADSLQDSTLHTAVTDQSKSRTRRWLDKLWTAADAINHILKWPAFLASTILCFMAFAYSASISQGTNLNYRPFSFVCE